MISAQTGFARAVSHQLVVAASGMEPVARAVEACQRGDTDTLEELLNNGLPTSTVDSDGCSLLHWASINNRVPIVQRLLSLGADPNIIGGVLLSTPLHWAARVGSIASCSLLIKAGANCMIRDNQGYSPIHLAVQGHHLNLVAYLLEKFDYAVNITDNSGMTPVMWSAYRSFSLFPLRMFIRKNADLDAKEHLQENTALHLAAQERNLVAIKELVAAGADVTIRNKQQETALDIAKNQRHKKIIEELEEGARKQGVLRIKCCATFRSEKFRRIWEFIFPITFLIAFYIIYANLHYGFASVLLLIAVVFMGYSLQINMHGGPNSSLVPVGVTLGEAFLMIIVWTIEIHWFAPWYLQLIFLIAMSALLISFSLVFFGNPGVIPASDTAVDFVEAVDSLSANISYCFTCWVSRPPFSKHCATCDRCVSDFDHHCPWLHQCVTRKNLRSFMVFVFCVGLTSVIYTGAGIRLLAIQIRDRGFDYTLQHYCFIILTIFLSILHACMMTALFITQLIQISSAVTTNEKIMTHRRQKNEAQRQHQHSGESSSDSGQSRTYNYQPTCSDRIENICNFCAGIEAARQESKLRRKVHDCIQDLIDLVTEEKLTANLPYLDCSSWDEVIEERFLARCCGLPICSNSVLLTWSHKYHIDRKNNKIFETCKERSKYCSEACFNASVAIRIQLDLQPLWITGESSKRMSQKYTFNKPKRMIEEISELKNLSLSEKPKRKNPYSVEVVEDTILANMDSLKIAERDGSSTEEDDDDDEIGLNHHRNEVREDSDDEFVEDTEFKASVNRFMIQGHPAENKRTTTQQTVKASQIVSSSTEKERLDRIRAKYSKKEQIRKPILIDAPALSIKKARETNNAEMVITKEEMEVDGEKVGVSADKTTPLMVDPSIIITPCTKEDVEFVINLIRQWWSEKSKKFMHAGGLRPTSDIDRLLRRFMAGEKGEDIDLEDVNLPDVDVSNVEKRRLQILLQNLKPTWILLEKKLDVQSTQLNTLSSLLGTFRLSADNIAGFERQHLRLITAAIWRIVCRFTEGLEESFFPGGFLSKEICDYLEFCGVEEPVFAKMCDEILQLVQC